MNAFQRRDRGQDHGPRVPGPLTMRVLAALGDALIVPCTAAWNLLGLAAAVLLQALRPSAWRRTVREEFVRHCHEVGIDALPAVLAVSALVGLGLVLQALYWLGLFGQSDVVGRLLVLVLVRELSPLIVSLLLIGRSASVYVTELSAVRERGTLTALDALGIDPFHLLVMPRVLAMSLCCCCLTVVFAASALLLGHLGASMAGLARQSLGSFASNVLDSMGIEEFVLIAIKPLSIGFVVALIACSVALAPVRAADGLRELLPRSFVWAMAAALLISSLLSALL